MNLETIDTIMAIDPGISGAITNYRKKIITAVNMPREIKDLQKYISYMDEISDNTICFLEKVQMYTSDQDHPGKRFMIAKMMNQYAELKTILTVYNIPVVEVMPIVWQKKLNLRIKGEEKSERKRRYKEIAQKENPELKVTLKTCDALLILKFGRIMLQNDKKWILDKLKINKSLF